MSDAEFLRARWSEPEWAELRERVIARGNVADAPIPSGEWEPGWPHDLRGIDLSDQRLVGVQLLELDHACFQRAFFSHCLINSASLTGADFSASRMQEGALGCCVGTAMVFERAQFSNIDLCSSVFAEARFGAADFISCQLAATRFHACDLRRARFLRCSFSGAKFTGSVLDGAVFEDCYLGYTDLRGVSLRGARLLRCDLEGAAWAGADLTDADVKTSMVTFG